MGLSCPDVSRSLGVGDWARRLAGQDNVLSAPGLLQPAANIRLGPPLSLRLRRNRIHFRRIDQIHTPRQGVINLLVSLGFSVLFTPSHGAQTYQADFKVRASKSAIFQGGAPSVRESSKAGSCRQRRRS